MGKQITLSGRLCPAVDGQQKTNSAASLGFLCPNIVQKLFLLSDFLLLFYLILFICNFNCCRCIMASSLVFLWSP